MMLTTHALVGAALGRVARHRPLSYLLGVASHALGDVLPHREYPLSVDGPLASGALLLIGLRYGWDSPEWTGAIGGITPDMEHLPTKLGWRTPEEEIFPTHGPYPQPWLHSMGRTPENNLVQIGLVAASLLVLGTPGEETDDQLPEE